MKNKKFLLPLFWLLSIAAMLTVGAHLKSESTEFFGISGNREQIVSFRYPVQIVKAHVVNGVRVAKDQVILELRRSDLYAEQVSISHQINELSARDNESVDTTRAELISLQAKKMAQLAKIDSEIEALHQRNRLNLDLLEQITGETGNPALAGDSPILAKLRGLKEQRRHVADSLQAQINNLQKKLDSVLSPAAARIAELHSKENDLKRQQADLTVKANFDGQIGSLMFAEGEQVPPYKPILSLYSASAETVKGYIHENVHNTIRAGQRIWIRSAASPTDAAPFTGIVEGLGARIVQYPDRLRKSILVPAWGREVTIRLTAGSDLLMGEKVIISLEKPMPLYDKALQTARAFLHDLRTGDFFKATALADDQRALNATDIRSALEQVDAQTIEASGIIRAPQTDRYLLVSDETFNDQAMVYEMDAQGMIKKVMPIKGRGDSLDDIESISSDGRYIYIASSLAHPERGKLPTQRKGFLRLQRKGDHFQVVDQIDLYATLEKVIRENRDSEISAYLKQGMEDHSLEIEGHFIDQGTLFLGFKSPLDTHHHTLILALGKLSNLFAQAPLNSHIPVRLNLIDPVNQQPGHLTDVVAVGEQLILSSTSKRNGEVSSMLWSYSRPEQQLIAIARYAGLKIEGMTVNFEGNELLLVFDRDGVQPSGLTRLPIVQSDGTEVSSTRSAWL